MSILRLLSWGQYGVDLVASPIHAPDGSWQQLQNSEFSSTQNKGGLKKRAGLSPGNSSALGGSIAAAGMIPLPSPIDRESNALGLYVGIDADVSGRLWLKSTDGTNFTDVAAATLGYASVQATTPSYSGGRPVAMYGGDMYFASGTQLISYSGSGSPVVRIPIVPAAGSIKSLFQAEGGLYLVVSDGNVYFYNFSDGSVKLWLNTASYTLQGQCAPGYGYVFIGGQNNTGGIARRFLPDGFFVTTNSGVNLTYMSGAYFASTGKVYYAQWRTNGGATMNVVSVANASAAFASDTSRAVSGDSAGYEQLWVATGLNLLFASFRDTNGTGENKIFKNTAGVWAQDIDLMATFSATKTAIPGTPVEFGGSMYWPYRDGSSGFLLKRTSGGVWTQQLTSKALTGVAGVVSVS